MFKKFLKVLYDHWLQIFGSILSMGGIYIIVKYWKILKSWCLSLIIHPATGWIILFLFIVVLVLKKLTRKKQKSGISFGNPPPPHKKKDLGRHELFGVMWNVWIGSYSLFDETQKLWADGPFCPDCSYELDRDYERHKWICVECNRNFDIPKSIREDTEEKVIKIFEAELRKSLYEKQKNKN